MAKPEISGIISCIDPLFDITESIVGKVAKDLGKKLIPYRSYRLPPEELLKAGESWLLLMNILPVPRPTPEEPKNGQNTQTEIDEGSLQIIGDSRLLEHILLPFPEPNTNTRNSQNGKNGEKDAGLYYPGIALIEKIRSLGLTLPIMFYTSDDPKNLNLSDFKRLSVTSLHRLPRNASLLRHSISEGLRNFYAI